MNPAPDRGVVCAQAIVMFFATIAILCATVMPSRTQTRMHLRHGNRRPSPASLAWDRRTEDYGRFAFSACALCSRSAPGTAFLRIIDPSTDAN